MRKLIIALSIFLSATAINARERIEQVFGGTVPGSSATATTSVAASVGGVIVSSPMAVINFSSNTFIVTESPTGQANVFINFSSITNGGISSSSGVSVYPATSTIITSSITVLSSMTVLGPFNIHLPGASPGYSFTFDPQTSVQIFNQESAGTPSGVFSFQTLGVENAYFGQSGSNVFKIAVATAGTNGGSGLGSTGRISINNSSASDASIVFNESNHGFTLGESSMTFESGSTDPTFSWLTDGVLNLTTGDLMVGSSSVCREDGTNCPPGSGGSDNLGSHISTQNITANFGISINNSSTNTLRPIDITSTGTLNAVRIVSNGFPSNGWQNDNGGALNIQMNGVHEGLVIVSSVVSTQNGSSFVNLINNATGYNDPIFWIHDVGKESNPFMRVDSGAPDMELVNTSTDNTHGLGKWEPMAMAFQGTYLQVNSRSYDNSTFERVAGWRPRSTGSGIELYPSVTGENGATASTNTFQIIWLTTDSTREVGLRGPKAASASWWWTLPNTFNNAGQVMYQSANGPDRELSFSTGGATGMVLTSFGNSVIWSTPTATGGVSVYPATATIVANFGVSAPTATITNAHTSTLFTDAFDVNTPGGFITGSGFGEMSWTELDGGGQSVQLQSPQTLSGNIVFILPSSGTTGGIMQVQDSAGDYQMSFTHNVSSLSINNQNVCLGDGTNCPSGVVSISVYPATSTVVLPQGIRIPKNLITTSYVIKSTDSVILASSTANSISTMTLPSAASNSGQWVQITKVDKSTNPVVLLPAAGEFISGITTVTLQSFMASQELISDGISNWIPKGGRIASRPSYMGNNQDVAGAAAGVSSTTYFQAWELQTPCDTKNAVFNVGTNAGLVNIVIYDEYGQLKVSSANAVPGGTGTRTIALPVVNLQPGTYYLGLQPNNAVITFTRYASNMLGAAMYSKSATDFTILQSIGDPPSFDNASTRSPAMVIECHGGAP